MAVAPEAMMLLIAKSKFSDEIDLVCAPCSIGAARYKICAVAIAKATGAEESLDAMANPSIAPASMESLILPSWTNLTEK